MTRNYDGSITLSQTKQLQQLFEEYPLPTRKSKYPAISRRDTDFTTENMNTIEDVDQIQSGFKYMRLLGQLNYQTNSRPDILPAVSYAATKSKTIMNKISKIYCL